MPFNTRDCTIEVTAWEGLAVCYAITSIKYRLIIQKRGNQKPYFKKFSKTGKSKVPFNIGHCLIETNLTVHHRVINIKESLMIPKRKPKAVISRRHTIKCSNEKGQK